MVTNFSADPGAAVQQLDAVFGRAPEPAMLLSEQGEISYANQRAKALLAAGLDGTDDGLIAAIVPQLGQVLRSSVTLPIRVDLKSGPVWFKAWRISGAPLDERSAMVMLFGDSAGILRSRFMLLRNEVANIEHRRARDLKVAQQLKTEAQHLRRLVSTDQLTGLTTGQELRKAVTKALERGTKTGALLFADLDGFKEINDTFGHSAGDTVLEHVGQRLLEHKRGEDVSARLGGDEFAFWIADVDAAIATRIAHRLRRQIERPVSWRGPDGQALDLVVGASFGIACYPQDGSDYAALANAADARMYTNKRDRKAVLPQRAQR
jgi:diguanylate cyclase (GGDEF)-like protein